MGQVIIYDSTGWFRSKYTISSKTGTVKARSRNASYTVGVLIKFFTAAEGSDVDVS